MLAKLYIYIFYLCVFRFHHLSLRDLAEAIKFAMKQATIWEDSELSQPVQVHLSLFLCCFLFLALMFNHLYASFLLFFVLIH